MSNQELQKRNKETILKINNRIFVPLQNKGASDFLSKRRQWEQALE